MKFCKDCIHFIDDTDFRKFYKCNALKYPYTNMVTGKVHTIGIYSCDSMRRDDSCGIDAKLFEQIPPPPEKKKVSFWKSFSMV